ncbi:MAG: hypothetical protein L6Q74_09020 [Sphaerotilus natans subsp. sulfidivorans]|jgi:hypothetical protein|uniref:hypothetical protein n=1 Tax=Sphaerotilus sulfidivorans TaxID=639200 RepID=UPI00235251E0|nr:hypothetical protein [Sphaerotilus sulfidivorans]MCK6402028.1 hypothetical protein [Sphaerotilus sulfidivorans]
MTQNHDEDRGSRDDAGRFRPGVSGNPSGRRRRSEADRQIDELARSRSEDAFHVVADLMTGSDNDRTKLAAALAILERAHGKPGERLADPINLEPGATLADQGAAVMQAACRGDITPAQASALLGCLGNLAKLHEITELERRIERLEKGTNE